MENKWEKHVSWLLKAELDRLNINYPKLSELLKQIGIEQTPNDISTKLHRGTFKSTFLLQCLCAIGIEQLNFRFDLLKDVLKEEA